MPGVMTQAVIPQLNPSVCRHPAIWVELPGERSLSKPHRTEGSTEEIRFQYQEEIRKTAAVGC